MHKILRDGVVDVKRLGGRIITTKVVLGEKTMNIINTMYHLLN